MNLAAARKDRLLDDEIIATYERDGIVVIPQILDTRWLNQLAEATEEILDRLRKGRGIVRDVPYQNIWDQGSGAFITELQDRGYYFTENAWVFNEKLRRFVFESPCAQLAAELMKSSEVRLFESVFIHKAAGHDTPTGWHQDLPQHGVSGFQSVSAWLSLDAVNEETGALRVVKGSHKGPWYTPAFMPPGRDHLRVPNEGGPQPDPDADPDRFPIVCYPTQPGDLILLHPTALHAARASKTGGRRRTFSLRMQGDDIRRKASPNEFSSWLKDLPLKDGDRMVAECFPRIWPPQSANGMAPDVARH